MSHVANVASNFKQKVEAYWYLRLEKETLSKLKLLMPVLFGSWVIRMLVSDIFFLLNNA